MVGCKHPFIYTCCSCTCSSCSLASSPCWWEQMHLSMVYLANNFILMFMGNLHNFFWNPSHWIGDSGWSFGVRIINAIPPHDTCLDLGAMAAMAAQRRKELIEIIAKKKAELLQKEAQKLFSVQRRGPSWSWKASWIMIMDGILKFYVQDGSHRTLPHPTRIIIWKIS